MLGTKVAKLFSTLMKQSLNSINPAGEPIAIGYFFPKEWNEQYLQTVLDPSGRSISQINVLKNKIGEHSGKVILKFSSQQNMEKFIRKYNEDYIIAREEAHRVVVKPFTLATQADKRERAEIDRRYGVKLTNLDYELNRSEIYSIAKDFGQVVHIEMQVSEKGLNQGEAKVYFADYKSSADFYAFARKLKLEERALKAVMIRDEKFKQKVVWKTLEQPKYLMQVNEMLYKRMAVKQGNEEKQKMNRIEQPETQGQPNEN